MKVKLATHIDCAPQSLKAEVEAEVPDGAGPIDETLYEAMAEACRLLAKAARENQMRMHGDMSEEREGGGDGGHGD